MAIHPARSHYKFNRVFTSDQIRTLILYVLSMTDISFLANELDKVFRRLYDASDLGQGINNLGNRTIPTTFPVDFVDAVKRTLTQRLHLSNIDSQMLDYVKSEMEGVLRELDVVSPFDVYKIVANEIDARIYRERVYILSIVGLRNYQLARTLESVEDIVRESVPVSHKNALYSAISESSEGQLLEYLIISDTLSYLTTEKYIVSQYRATYDDKYVGEVDMVVRNKSTDEYSLFEVKRSDKIDKNQVKHFTTSRFMDSFRLAMSNPKIKTYNVIYLGNTELNTTHPGSIKINYINAKDYLLDISNWV